MNLYSEIHLYFVTTFRGQYSHPPVPRTTTIKENYWILVRRVFIQRSNTHSIDNDQDVIPIWYRQSAHQNLFIANQVSKAHPFRVTLSFGSVDRVPLLVGARCVLYFVPLTPLNHAFFWNECGGLAEDVKYFTRCYNSAAQSFLTFDSRHAHFLSDLVY